MLSKAQIKFIQSLHDKKNRMQQQLYIAEGTKIAREIIESASTQIHSIYATELYNKSTVLPSVPCYTISEKELKQISQLQTPNHVIIVLKMPIQAPIVLNNTKRYIALDNIKDPGNLGTIIRSAEWFGIDTIICDSTCVDYTNVKVIMSSMGSFLRVRIWYCNLKKILSENKHLPIMGATLQGENVYETKLPNSGILCIGSESHGISDDISTFLTHKIHIPAYGKAESLNASVACAVICSEWNRQIYERK